MAKKTKARKLQQPTLETTAVRVDLVRTADGKSTADRPLTVANVPAALDELADRIEVNWPDVLPFVSERAEFCAWRLRELHRAIAHSDGIVLGRDAAGNLMPLYPPGCFDLLDLLGQAIGVCSQVARDGPNLAQRVREKGGLPPQAQLRNLAKLIRAAALTPDEARRKLSNGTATGTGDDSTLDERAVAIKVAHADWSDQQVADTIGCMRTSLFKPNMVKYKQAKQALASGREVYRRGAKSERRRPSNIDRRDRDDDP